MKSLIGGLKMKIEVILASKENEKIIKNMYPLYLHDLSEHYEEYPNEYGIYEEEPIKTLEEQYDVQNIWFEKPEALYPNIIMVDEKPAGFILISKAPYAPKTTDYYLSEFFLLRPYRGRGIAEKAANEIFKRYIGRWELYTNHVEKNIAGQKFWRKTISNYTNDEYEESIGDTVHGTKMIFRLQSK